MAVGKLFAVVAVVFGILLSLYFNQPIPEGLPDDAYQGLRVVGISMKVLGTIDKLGAIVGAWNQVDFLQGALNFAAGIVIKAEDSAVKSWDTHIAGVPVRVFRPTESANDERLPTVLYYHGGGWVLGSVVTHTEACRTISKQAHLMVVSVEYRRAPAHTFPSAFDDCYTVAEALLNGKGGEGIDESGIVLMGDSAGGNLAAAVTLQLRQTKTRPAAQVLIYPALQFMDLNLPYYKMHGTWILDQRIMSRFWSLYLLGSEDMVDVFLSGNHSAHLQRTKYASYLSDTKVDHSKVGKSPYKDIPGKVLDALTDPRASPLMADDLSGLPPTFILTCEFDVLKNEGVLFKKRLQASGNEVTFKTYLSYHGVFSMSDRFLTPVERQRMFRDISEFLEELFSNSK